MPFVEQWHNLSSNTIPWTHNVAATDACRPCRGLVASFAWMSAVSHSLKSIFPYTSLA
jgi:hypothetical protein